MDLKLSKYLDEHEVSLGLFGRSCCAGSWRIATGCIQAGEQSVWQKFTSCLTTPCVCGRDWVSAAPKILRVNRIDERQVTDDIKRCLLKGLHTKGQVLSFAGYGNEE